MVSLYSGKYTIKSTYDMICKSKVEAYANTSLNQVWETIWGSNLHGRHALLIWKWVTNAIPTIDRIQRIKHTASNLCYQCGIQEEIVHHLALEFLFTTLIWR